MSQNKGGLKIIPLMIHEKLPEADGFGQLFYKKRKYA